MQFLVKHWDVIKDILGLIVIPLVAILVSSGFLRRRNRALKDLMYIEQQFEAFKKAAAAAEKRLKSEIASANTRLNRIDPDRFVTQTRSLTDAAKFAEAEKLAIDFTTEQTPAFGLAAEILAEQSILASGEFGKSANDDALRFLTIGLAANPTSTRLRELQKLAQSRAQAIERGEPIETLNWDGLSDVELNRLAHSLSRDGKYQLAEIAARRSVPLALMRTGEYSQNFAAALSTHAGTLRQMGAFIEAEALVRHTLDIARATIGTGHPDYVTHLYNLAGAVVAQGRYAEAEGLYRQGLEVSAATSGTAHLEYATHLNNLAGVVLAQGRFAEAEGLSREALVICLDKLGDAHPHTHTAAQNLLTLLLSHFPDDPEIPALQALLTPAP